MDLAGKSIDIRYSLQDEARSESFQKNLAAPHPVRVLQGYSPMHLVQFLKINNLMPKAQSYLLRRWSGKNLVCWFLVLVAPALKASRALSNSSEHFSCLRKWKYNKVLGLNCSLRHWKYFLNYF
jgi:hypothetical protein